MGTRIHPTAIVDSRASLAADVEVGPYTIIGADTEVGAGTRIGPHVVIGPHTSQLVAEKLQPLAMVDVKGLRHPLQVFTLPTSTLTSLG